MGAELGPSVPPYEIRNNRVRIIVRLQRQAICVSLGLLLTAGLTMAQSANVYFALGTATDSSSNRLIDTFGDGVLYRTPDMNGVFPKLGATLMLTPHLGFGADVSWRAARADYAGLLYRPSFYNFDAVWTPIATSHFEPEIHGGIGGMKLGFSYKQTSCDPFTGCQTSDQSLESSSHFQWHLGAAARIYATDHVFVRPAIDFHYVHNLFQFGRNSVPEYSLGIGYSFGRY
jgi:hypothetical protein